ncbi:hypothetical protein TDIS_1841 [Thermosulfurimonas dismutans]|uniref:Uncharacterized protein n=1 Tax=Thermosulfurimonas dismutans TaxID=999894 RepID=A0A179D3H4_9BACT|nr:hypothetical protein TDIS_1841 [Thermosulfurimonas dismutans]
MLPEPSVEDLAPLRPHNFFITRYFLGVNRTSFQFFAIRVFAALSGER